MIYRRYYADAIRDGLTPIVICRKAEKQSGSYVILANEEPGGAQRQVLVMDGKQGRDKVPLIMGDEKSVKNIVGSVMIRIQGQQLAGVVGFASDQAAQAVRQQYLAGELTLHLITNPIAGVELSSGQTFRGVDGPAMVLTEWEPLHVVLELKKGNAK